MMVTILEYARKSLKLIKENPARGVTKPPDRKQRRFLTFEEMTKLGQAIRESEARGGNATALAATCLLLWNASRFAAHG